MNKLNWFLKCFSAVEPSLMGVYVGSLITTGMSMTITSTRAATAHQVIFTHTNVQGVEKDL